MRAVLSYGLGLLLWSTWVQGQDGSAHTYEEKDASDSSVQALLKLADRSGRAEQGFAPLPTEGSVGRLTRKPGAQVPADWLTVALSLNIQKERWTRSWYFGREDGLYVFLAETETIHSRNKVTTPQIGNGSPGLDPISWTPFERWIRCRAWNPSRWRDGRGGSFRMSSR